MPIAVPADVLDGLSTALWQERRLLEQLQFKLQELQLLVDAGRHRWVVHATREVESVLGDLEAADRLRVDSVDALVAAAGLPDGSTLLEVAAGAPEPWDEILAEHHRCLGGLVQGTSSAAALVGATLAREGTSGGRVLTWMASHPLPSARPVLAGHGG